MVSGEKGEHELNIHWEHSLQVLPHPHPVPLILLQAESSSLASYKILTAPPVIKGFPKSLRKQGQIRKEEEPAEAPLELTEGDAFLNTILEKTIF